MTADHPTTPDALHSLRAELARERARADTADALSRVQADSLAVLATLAHNLRCDVADLMDAAHSSNRIPPQGLRNVTARMNGLAETLDRAARGYADARTTDMLYPTIDDDLVTHRWTPRPDQELDGTLPPISITEMADQRGYRRGWHRGPQTITCWFTGPYALAYAHASGHGRLVDVDQIRAVITSQALSAAELAEWITARQAAHAEPFDAPYLRAFEHLRATWGGPIETQRCDDHGVRQSDGNGTTSVFGRPSNRDFRVYLWGIGDKPAHVRYWAGPVADMAHLIRITGDYR